MTVRVLLVFLFAAGLCMLLQVPTIGSAQALQVGSPSSKAVTLVQGGRRFNRCMQRCFDQGYNTRLCPSKCGSQ